jgi:galactose mutarotase-like enzyme
MSEIFERSRDGFTVVGLRSADLELAVVPELGAKIISLKSVPSGHEWLWHPGDSGANVKLFRNKTGDDFATSTMTGIDECIPTISPCPWRGRNLPDHGEAWSSPWHLDRAALTRQEVATRIDLPLSPLTLERRLTLAGPQLRFDYSLTNRGSDVEEYLWAIHPLLSIGAGDRVELPEEVHELRLENAGNPDGARGETWPWPRPHEGIDLTRLQIKDSHSSKIKGFTAALQQGWAKLHSAAASQTLTMRFDPAKLNTLGFWLTRGGWNGYHHLALEPTNGAPDRLDLAVTQWRRYATIAPGTAVTWDMLWTIG